MTDLSKPEDLIPKESEKKKFTPRMGSARAVRRALWRSSWKKVWAKKAE